MNEMKKKSGFLLIEVLIAMLVLSLGLLGLAGLQARGLRNNVSAYNRGQATQLAYDMAGRIRANVVEAKVSASSNPATSAYETATAKAQGGCNSAPGCTAAQLVQNDLYEWNQAILASGLPLGIGQIEFDAKLPFVIKTGVAPLPDRKIKVGIITITISWDDDRDNVIENGEDGNRVDCDTDSDSVNYCDPSFQMSFQLWSVEA